LNLIFKIFSLLIDELPLLYFISKKLHNSAKRISIFRFQNPKYLGKEAHRKETLTVLRNVQAVRTPECRRQDRSRPVRVSFDAILFSFLQFSAIIDKLNSDIFDEKNKFKNLIEAPKAETIFATPASLIEEEDTSSSER
jgi:hypothetical protein